VGEPDIWSAMRAVGLDGTEATVEPDGGLPLLARAGKSFSIAGSDRTRELGDEMKEQRKAITAFCLHNRFDERPDQEIELTVKTARAAAQLGIPAVRLDIVPRKIMDQDDFLKLAVTVGRKIVEATQDLRVRFGVENHGPTTNRPEFLRRMFDGIGSRRFGLTLDIGNFYWFGHPLSRLYDIFAEFAPWVCHTHCKNIRYPEAEREKQRPMGWKYSEYCCPVYEGDIDYQRVIQVLRKAGYRGDLCLDDESLGRFPKDRRREVLKKDVEFLRRMKDEG
jgi:sugar phosphate isomerase/epimerase